MTPQYEEIALPISGVVLQYRDRDDCRRILGDREASFTNTEAQIPDVFDDLWSPYNETPSGLMRAQGDSAGGSEWFVVTGQMPPTGDVGVTLDDGQRLEVVILVRIWAAEWVRVPQGAKVRWGDDQVYRHPTPWLGFL